MGAIDEAVNGDNCEEMAIVDLSDKLSVHRMGLLRVHHPTSVLPLIGCSLMRGAVIWIHMHVASARWWPVLRLGLVLMIAAGIGAVWNRAKVLFSPPRGASRTEPSDGVWF